MGCYKKNFKVLKRYKTHTAIMLLMCEVLLFQSCGSRLDQDSKDSESGSGYRLWAREKMKIRENLLFGQFQKYFRLNSIVPNSTFFSQF
jgi:hypothetical protein